MAQKAAQSKYSIGSCISIRVKVRKIENPSGKGGGGIIMKKEVKNNNNRHA